MPPRLFCHSRNDMPPLYNLSMYFTFSIWGREHSPEVRMSFQFAMEKRTARSARMLSRNQEISFPTELRDELPEVCCGIVLHHNDGLFKSGSRGAFFRAAQS